MYLEDIWDQKYYLEQFEHDKSYYELCNNDFNLIYENWEPLGVDPKTCQHILLLKTTGESPEDCQKNIKNFVISRMQDILRNFWPNAYKNETFNWDLLTDPENRTGVERFDAQFWQCNLNPTDLYNQILTNTSQYRITTDGSWIQQHLFYRGLDPEWFQSGNR